ncbi:MAG: metallophosphoesterase [Candidatus Omnitrophica bacterium]|nr:metallophosphoesterase [Candidatus Omnitrophota bacterium]
MKKIIHMSDLHIGYKNFKERFVDIIDSLLEVLPGNPGQYVVIITGDLVNNANKKDSYQEAQYGLDYLKKLGFKHVLVIPGNHDYGTGNRGKKKFIKLFKVSFYGKEIDYPKVDIIDNIAYIGLDSMAKELNWYNELWAQGQLGKKQLSELENILNQNKIKACSKRVIYLHHHPFKWRPLHELKDSRKLHKVLKKIMDKNVSIDAVLFGHNHEGKPHNGKWGIPRCYDAGTATLKPRPKYVDWAPWFKVKASIRVIDLSRDPETDYIVVCKYQKDVLGAV